MRFRVTRWFVLLPVLASSTVAFRGVPSAVAAEPECRVAMRWAKANKADLPTSVAGFAALSRPMQRAAYNYMPVVQRRALWREHLDSVRSQLALTKDQRVLVDKAAASLERRITADVASGRDAVEAEGFTTVFLKQQFGDSLATTIFSRLAPLGKEAGANTGGAAPSERAAPYTNCSCSSASNYCFTACQLPEIGDCIWLPSGCGTFLCYPCDGCCGTTYFDCDW